MLVFTSESGGIVRCVPRKCEARGAQFPIGFSVNLSAQSERRKGPKAAEWLNANDWVNTRSERAAIFADVAVPFDILQFRVIRTPVSLCALTILEVYPS
jgi:hypothetical protein